MNFKRAENNSKVSPRFCRWWRVVLGAALWLVGGWNPLHAAQPNIIFILCDDLGYGDTGVFFQNARALENVRSEPSHFTPNLDALAADGMQLRQHYCPAPVCAP